MKLTKKVLLEMVEEVAAKSELLIDKQKAAVEYLAGYLEDLENTDDWEEVHAEYVGNEINPANDLVKRDESYSKLYKDAFTISDETELKDHKLAVQLFKYVISKDMGESPEEMNEGSEAVAFTHEQIVEIIEEELAAVLGEMS